MEIEHVSPEEIRIKITANPCITESGLWLEKMHAALTGQEKRASVDLTALDVISSLGVNLIVGFYKSMEKQGGSVHVRVPSQRMAHVFELFRLVDLLHVEIAAP